MAALHGPPSELLKPLARIVAAESIGGRHVIAECEIRKDCDAGLAVHGLHHPKGDAKVAIPDARIRHHSVDDIELP